VGQGRQGDPRGHQERQEARPRQGRPLNLRERGLGLRAFLPLAVLLAAAGVLPLFSALGESFFHDVYGERSPAGLENYRILFSDASLGRSALLSCCWALLQTLVVTASGYALALLMYESKRARAPVYAALILPWALPAVIAVPLWRMIIHGASGDSLLSRLFALRVNLLTDGTASFVAAILVSAWMRVPAAAFVFYAALRKVPERLLDAARMDGAGRAALSAGILFPFVAGSTLAAAALEFASAFKEFSVPFLLTGGGPPLVSGITDRAILGATTTLEVYLYDIFQGVEDYGLSSAYAAVAGIAVAILSGLALLAGRREGASRPRREGGRARRLRRPFRVPGSVADAGSLALRLAAGLLAAASATILAFALLRTAFSGLSSTYIEGFLPLYPTARNFYDIFARDGIGRTFLNTLVVALGAAALCPLVIMPAALRLRRCGPALRALVFVAVQAVGAAGGMHSLIPLYGLFRSLGLLGGYAPVIFVYLFHAAPYSLFVATAWLDSFPPSIEESALIEGASRSRTFFSILLPLSLPAAAIAAMTAFLAAWNGFLVPLLFLDDDSMYTIALRLYSYVGGAASGAPKWNRFAAASIVSLVLVGALLWLLKGPLGKAPTSEHEE
jgi:ABC-type glycerol-3-phosphate transport system permease component